MKFENLVSILCCPDCSGNLTVSAGAEQLRCDGCNRAYPVVQGILCLLPSNPKPLPAVYQNPDYIRMSENFDDSSPYFTEENSIFRMIHESAHLQVAEWERRYETDGWMIDLGCGQGYHWPFAARPDRLVGIDIRLESLLKIREHHPEALLVQANFLSLPFKTASIAQALSVYAFEHVYFLEDALMEMGRVLEPRAKAFVGLPCEGGLAWTLGRKVTSERTMSRRYNVDYRQYIALEHCNSARRVEKALGFHFRTQERRLFPFDFLPVVDVNLTLCLSLEKL